MSLNGKDSFEGALAEGTLVRAFNLSTSTIKFLCVLDKGLKWAEGLIANFAFQNNASFVRIKVLTCKVFNVFASIGKAGPVQTHAAGKGPSFDGAIVTLAVLLGSVILILTITIFPLQKMIVSSSDVLVDVEFSFELLSADQTFIKTINFAIEAWGRLDVIHKALSGTFGTEDTVADETLPDHFMVFISFGVLCEEMPHECLDVVKLKIFRALGTFDRPIHDGSAALSFVFAFDSKRNALLSDPYDPWRSLVVVVACLTSRNCVTCNDNVVSVFYS